MPLLTPGQVIVRIIAVVMLVETAVMLSMRNLFGPLPLLTEAVINALLLAVLSTSPIYAFVIRPFTQARDEALALAEKQALTDPLTALANRRLFTKHLEKSIASAYRHYTHGALLLIDLDGFKKVNDTFGHGTGDLVLLEFAKRIQSITRSDDICARLGGDEFAVLVSALPEGEADAKARACLVAEKLISLAAEPIPHPKGTARIGASVGIRVFGHDEELAAKSVITEADVALYSAKRAGKGVAVVFEDQMVMAAPSTTIGGRTE